MKGQIHTLFRGSKGLEWRVSIDFDNTPEFHEIISKLEELENFQPDCDHRTIDLVPQAKRDKPGGCPQHGFKSLKADQGGEGFYCAARVGDGFCSRKSWKDWSR